MKSAEKRVPEFVWHEQRRREAGVPAGAVRGRRLRLVPGQEHDPDLLLHPQRAAGPRRAGLCCSSSAWSARRAEYANGEIKLVIGNRRDARRFERNVGLLGREAGEARADPRRPLPTAPSSNATDRIPFLAEYVRADSGARGDDRKWLEKHSIDRVDDWERGGHEILSRIASTEVKQVIAPLVASGWYFATVESVTDAGVQPVYSIRVDSDDHAFLAGGFVNHNTESRLAPLAMQLLGEIDEDTVDFTPTYDGNTRRAGGAPGAVPEPPGQRRRRHRRRYGDEHPAAQPRRGRSTRCSTCSTTPTPRSTTSCSSCRAPTSRPGALILGRSGIHDAYRPVAARSRCAPSPRSRRTARATCASSVTEVPYQTSVEVIGQKIAELVNDRKIEGIRDVRNESSGDTHAPRRRAQARRQRAGRAQPALQAHPDADQLPGAHAGAGRRRAAAARPRRRRSRSTSSTRRRSCSAAPSSACARRRSASTSSRAW